MNQITSIFIPAAANYKKRKATWISEKIGLAHVRMTSQTFVMGFSFFFVLLFNKAFFSKALTTVSIDGVDDIFFLMSLIPLMWMLNMLVISLLAIPRILQCASILLLLMGAFAAYFMDTYGVAIDKEMIRNVLQTDFHESMDLFSPVLIAYVLILGVAPAYLVSRIKVTWSSTGSELIKRVATIAICLLLSILLILSFSTHYSSFFRIHKEVRFFSNPLGLVYAGSALLSESLRKPQVIERISDDAVLGTGTKQQTKPVLVVFVVGETARLANFGLAGYERETTPLLKKQDIVFFDNVSSCGTSTAVSVPCMFSNLSRKQYSETKAQSQHNLLDFISKAGISVFWRDNNSGCKGICSRVNNESIDGKLFSQWCKGSNCFDEVLLDGLDEKLSGGNEFIVLHQKGSHGPSYDERYPESSRVFTPVCKTNQLQKCAREEVINAYDNTVIYTDYFLNHVIEWLKGKQDSYNTLMVYVSDHGESLGENNLYLHGMPYAIAPQSQKQVPFIFWASASFYHDRKLSQECVKKSTGYNYSHDNLFHSFLGLLDIKTKYYQPELDMFHSCIERLN